MNDTITPPKLVKSQKGWYVYYSVYENGKRKKYTYTDNMNREKNLKERQKIANQLLRDIVTLHEEKKSDVPRDLRPLSTLLDEMLELKKSSVRERSYETYKYALGVFKRFVGNRTDFKGLDFADWLVREGYSGRGFNNLVTLNRVLFNMLLDREVIEKNPLKKIPLQPQTDNKHMAFDCKQKEKIKRFKYRLLPFGLLFVRVSVSKE